MSIDGIQHPVHVPPVQEPTEEAVLADASLPDPFALLDQAVAPQEIAWEASHTLSPSARRKHIMLAALLGGAGMLVAFWQGSVISMVAILLALVVWEMRERFASSVSARIDSRGIWVDGVFHPHVELASFDIHRMPDGIHEVSIHSARWHTPHIRVPLGEQDPELVRSVLLQHLIEERHRIPPLEWWMRS